MPSETTWVALAIADVQSAWPAVFASQNGQDVDPVATATYWLPKVVAEFVGVIAEANRVAPSQVAGTVPPEAQTHALALVAEKVVVNSQRLAGLLFTQEGEQGPLGKAVSAAREWLRLARTGLNVTAPSLPVANVAGSTPVVPLGVQWGNYYVPVGGPTTKTLNMAQDGQLFNPP